MNDFKKQKINKADAAKTKTNHYKDVDLYAHLYQDVKKKSELFDTNNNNANTYNNVYKNSDKKYRPQQF